jgi:cytochrome c-type biogenesis protein CcmH
MLILTFLAILSGAGLALAWFMVAPPIVAQLAASRFGHVLRSRGAMALLLILPFAAVAAAIMAQGDRLRPSLAAAPSAPPVPLDQARKEAPHDLEAAVKQLEARLAKEPNDQDGWRLLARSYTELGDTAKAEDAARHAAALGAAPGAAPGDAEAQSAHGEDLVEAAKGVVTPEARDAFTAALAADPQDPRARFFLGLAAAQDGKTDDAVQRWLELERDSPPDAPWLQGLRANLDRLAQQAGIGSGELAKRRSALAAASPMPAPALPAAPAGAAPGPTPADIAAAQQMNPDDRQAMIRTMVQRLADQMEQNPKDVDGWLRLGRAYAVLGEQQKSLDAYRRASEADPTRDDARQAYATAKSAMGDK